MKHNLCKMAIGGVVVLAVTMAMATGVHAAPFFTGLGDLPGGSFHSIVGGEQVVSADGSVVVGQSTSASGTEAFRWTENGGIVGLGDLPGGGFASLAFGTSADGLVVVGSGTSASGTEAFRWTENGGMVGLGDLAGGGFSSTADATSADGSVVAGTGTSASGTEAFRWTENGGMIGLGDLPGDGFLSLANNISRDGLVIVGAGRSGTSPGGDEAFRWTESGGMVGLGDLPGGLFSGVAHGTSRDGSVVVGSGTSASGTEAFRWTENGGMVGLGDLAGGGFSSVAYAVSGDGSVIVGGSVTAIGHDEAFIWDSEDGMRHLQTVLVNDFGLDLTGWTLEQARSISDDGLVIAGSGRNPDGNFEAWVANLRVENEAPTAVAGNDESIRVGDTVFLYGGDSFDDNTLSEALQYAWTLIPLGCPATLDGADTATPSFVAHIDVTCGVQLIVTDEGGLSSAPDEVLISSKNNLAPTAVAGADQLVIVGSTVFLDGSGSMDPESDPLMFSWLLTAVPVGSNPSLTAADTATPTLVADLEGPYEVTLTVSDFIGPGTPDSVEITATTVEGFAESRIMCAADIVSGLEPAQVTTKGNQNAFLNFLRQAVEAIQEDDTTKAIDKLRKAIERTNGCEANASPDGNGPGRDWITDCNAQDSVLSCLREALQALTP